MPWVTALFTLLLWGCGAPPAPAPEAEPGSPAPASWDQHIADLLPAIDSCIAGASADRSITYAALDQGGVLVRLDGADGKLDCRVDLDGGHARIAPADPDLIVDGDGAAIFVRGPGENPGGECYEAPEVRGADGALLGWMLDPLGC